MNSEDAAGLMGVLGFFFGLVIGAGTVMLAIPDFVLPEKLVEHECAHYDEKTGKLQWNTKDASGDVSDVL